MTNVAEMNGTVNFDQELNDTRQIWRAAVAEVAEKATAALPQCQGRIDKAVSLVLAGAVDMLGDGTARVASQSNGQTIYHIVNGHCDCRDYEHAPESWCKHRLAHAIAKRAYTQAKAKVDTGAGGQATKPQPAVPTPALPEAPASVNVHLEMCGRQVQLTLRDADEDRLLARLETVLQRFPLGLTPKSTPAISAEGWCTKHGVQMHHNHKDGRAWYSHKTQEGWCKGK